MSTGNYAFQRPLTSILSHDTTWICTCYSQSFDTKITKDDDVCCKMK